MEIRITHKNTEIDERVRKLIEKKCEKLKKFNPRIDEIDIVLRMENTYRCFTEINLPVRGGVIHGRAEMADPLSSFEEALSKVERQLKKRRQKMVEHTPKTSIT